MTPPTPEVLFGELLSRPLHTPRLWKKRRAASNELSLAKGVWFASTPGPFSSEELEVALEDFQTFLNAQSIPLLEKGEDGLPIYFERLPASPSGRLCIEVTGKGVRLSAESIGGIRRALVWLEEEMLGREGAFLPLGLQEWSEVIRTRISRCFYGPIQRPPLHRHELADDINYYPEGYLNRLAHDGVTALWITIKFSESVPSRLFLEFGKHSVRHLAKLQNTVERCARYGIKIYAFCIEPAALAVDSPILKRHCDLKGAQVGGFAAFCTQSDLGARYLEEATEALFKAVPGLGGLIVIPVGERLTHCASRYLSDLKACPRCSLAGQNKVLHDVLDGFRRGMDKVAPEAELIAWPYGQMILWGAEKMMEAADHIPPKVVLQHNYETGGVAIQLGKPRPLWDYWLSWTGVSPVFAGSAERTVARKGRIAAKLQVGNSHENATVPFLPAPGLLYRKYRAMHALGVSGAMQSWYFGNYPSLMTRAAGRLSYAPLPATEEEFLLHLARKEWGKQAGRVARAWASFDRGYENYPATHLFSYYGPVQNGVTWPLYLKPRREPLSPTWQVGFPPSGDYLPHCFSHYFTLRELIQLCTRMARHWQHGCRHLQKAYAESARTPEQTHEWQIAEAIRIQFENALAILQFYALREQLADAQTPSKRQTLLKQMSALVREEISRRQVFIELLKREPTLGYHSEAEDFKITIPAVEAAISQLQGLLRDEFTEVEREVNADGSEWFGDYTGRDLSACSSLVLARDPRITSEETALRSALSSARQPIRFWLAAGIRESFTAASSTAAESAYMLPVSADFRMLASLDSLYFVVDLAIPPGGLTHWAPSVVVEIEPTRMQPRVKFALEASGTCKGYYEDGYLQPNPTFSGSWRANSNGTQARLEIPQSCLALPRTRKPFRVNVRVIFAHLESGEIRELSWVKRKPIPSRLIWADINPATDYGWAVWEKPAQSPHRKAGSVR